MILVIAGTEAEFRTYLTANGYRHTSRGGKTSEEEELIYISDLHKLLEQDLHTNKAELTVVTYGTFNSRSDYVALKQQIKRALDVTI